MIVGTSPPIVWQYGAGSRFFVAVWPCPDDEPSLREYGDYLEARTAARLLRFGRGWKLVDDVSLVDRRAAEQDENSRRQAKRVGARNAAA